MLGINMLLAQMGIKPEEIQAQVQALLADVNAHRVEQERQGRLIDAMARAQGINPRDFDAPSTKEIEHV